MSTRPELRQPSAADCPRLSEIARAAKAHWDYPAAWLAAWHEQLTIRPIDLERWSICGAWLGGSSDEDLGLAGFYALSVDGEEAELEHLWVDPAAMGHGLGRALVEHAIEQARHGGARRMEIESDPYAEPFYVHLGARKVGEVARPVLGEDRTLPILVIDL